MKPLISFMVFACFYCFKLNISAKLLNESLYANDVDDLLKSGQENLQMRMELMNLHMEKQKHSIEEIRKIIDENFTKLFYLIKQKQEDDCNVVPENFKLINSSHDNNEISCTDHLVEENHQGIPEKFYMFDMNQKDEPKVCQFNTDGKLICSDLALPTMCADSNSLNCVNNKCRVRNSIYGPQSFWISCDGQWTVIQRRLNGSVNFNRNWNDYKNGFGDLDGEFWLGLDKLHSLTNIHGAVELYIEMQDFQNIWKYATYDRFIIANETLKYTMNSPGTYYGNAGDSLRYSQHEKFSTYDADNDSNTSINCASQRQGGWWYFRCNASEPYANLNGRYYDSGMTPDDKLYTGINWKTFGGGNKSMKFVQMKIRPKK
ncbi:ficolin-2-like [Haematobia irritans]|uniref:ficolin-2-like n=1 Tax=Haematobia irritans TaxID=7368 RepID=UPI003F50391B